MQTDKTGTLADHQAFATDPMAYFDHSVTKVHSIPRDALERLQRAALAWRFETLGQAIPMVAKLAGRQGIARIGDFDDIVPLLFEHSMYKSYPPSLIDNGRFDLLTRWLDKLTAHDLSGIDASACRGITDWVMLLDAQSPIRLNHSSGTSGLMSFSPFSSDEYDRYGRQWPVMFCQDFGDPPPPADGWNPHIHLVSPNYRHGANAYIRGTDMQADYIAGGEERVHCLYPGRLDSDVMHLAARIAAAKARGALDQLKVSPQLMERQKAFQAERARMAEDVETFFAHIVDRLAGERVFIQTTWKPIYDLAMMGLARGMRGVFHPDSVVISGGGAKGMSPPADWEERVCEFIGVRGLKGGYGMSEMCALNIRCAQGHYHLAPWVIYFVLDPDSSRPLGREGVTTGRLAFFDLLPDSHWGGFITGDEVTLHWDGDCPCGMATAYVEGGIERYGDKRGGDDKISCAATPDAHREAMDFLTRIDGAG